MIPITNFAAALILLAAALAPVARAATTGTWDVNGGGLWSSSTSWTGGVPGSAGDTANLTFNLTAACLITNDSSRSIGVLNIGDSGSKYYAYTLTNNSGATLTFDNHGSGASLVQSTTTANDVIATPVVLNDNLSLNNNSASATLTLSGSISGNQNLVKFGAGTLNLTGANTFTGSRTVTNGTVNVSSDQSAATGGWLMPVNLATATVNCLAGSTVVVAGTNEIQIGSWPATGTPNYQTLNVMGTVSNSGSLLVARGGILNVNSNGVWIQGGNLTNGPPGGSGYSANLTVNRGGSFTYIGTNLIVLSPSAGNSGSSTLTIGGGTFTTTQGFANNISPGGSTGAAQIILTNNGILALAANIPQLTSGLNTNGVPLIGLGLGGGAINTAGYATTITNLIGGAGSLTKLGPGTLTLGTANTYTGATTVSNGTLALLNSGFITSSPLITVAATNATLQLTQSGSLTNTVLLVINAGGMVALNAGVNQTVGALCLGGQWESDGTWGSTASAAANKTDAWFSGTGMITVAHRSLAPGGTPPFISSWDVRYYEGDYDNVNPAPGVIAFMPYPGWDYVPTSSANLNSYEFQYNNGWPVAAYFVEATAPVGDNTNLNGTYQRSNSVADTVAFFTTNTSPAMPLNYVLSDFEPYDQTLAHCELEITNLLNLVRAASNTNVYSSFVGNYACYAGGTDAALTPSARIGTDSFYRNSGLNVAQPNAYPYSSYTNNGPNARSGLFWSDLELVSFAKMNLPAGHKLVPWLDNTLSGDPVGVPTVGDCVALLAHVRLRGADGFSDLGGLVNLTYGWTDLDWLFHGAGSPQILNLTTSEDSGFQWSGCSVGANLAFLFSNLGNSAGTVSLPSFPGLPTSSPAIPAGTHTAWYFVNDANAIATNQLILGRNGINHGLFVDGSFTLTNAIQVVQDADAIPAAVTIGTYFTNITNTFSPTFAGPLSLNNNVTLQDYGGTLTFAGTISGVGGITTVGNLAFNGVNTYGGGTTIASGALRISNASGLGGGSITISNGSTLQLALTGRNFVFNAFNGFNATTFTGDSTVPDLENISGTNMITSSLTVIGTGGHGLALKSDAGSLSLDGMITAATSSMNVELNVMGNGVIAGKVVDGSGGIAFGLQKDGSGVWTLIGDNTYTGATAINNGALLVNGSLAADSAVTVSQGGSLGGTGLVGGTVALSGAVAPGSGGVGTLTTGGQTWNGGGSYVFQLNNATNNSGGGFLNINGALDIQATSGNPFTINLISLTATNTPGVVAGFGNANNQAWAIATASGGIVNFDPACFLVNTTAFSNAFTGTFTMTTNGNSLLVNYAPLLPPVLDAGPAFGNGLFTLSFSGSSGQSYRVLASTNLELPVTNWLVLTNGAFGPNVMQFTDQAATNGQKFYRLASP